MKYFSLILLLLFITPSCQKACEDYLPLGEMVQIPVEFVDFTLTEMNTIKVYRIDNLNPSQIDTFLLRDILWVQEARAFNETITDRAPGQVTQKYGYYDSYLDQGTLVLDWDSNTDTLSNISIKKSKGEIEGDCYKNAPNVTIDHLSFIHKGKTISKNESIQIRK